MSNQVIEDVIKQIIKLGLATEDDFVGCSENKIQDIIKAQNVTFFPKIYHELLLRMGQKGFEKIMDCDCLCKHLYKMKQYTKENYPDHPLAQIPDDAFVFADDVGGAFLYFQTSQELEDPPVTVFNDYKWGEIKRIESFSEFLRIVLSQIEDQVIAERKRYNDDSS